MWAIYALAAALLTSFNPILYKRLLTKSEPVVVVWSVIGLALPLLAVTTWVLTPTLPRVDAAFVVAIALAAILNTLAHLASARSLKLADASLVTPLLTFSPAFTLLLSIPLLGELPDARRLFGIGLILSGAYWLNRGATQDWLMPFKSLAAKPGVGLVLLAGLLWAITPIFEKIAIQHTFPENPRFTALVSNGLLVSLLTPFVWQWGHATRSALVHQRRAWLLAALIAGSAPLLGFTAFSLGPVGYVATLFRVSAVLTVIWSEWLLGEPGLRQRLPASVVMVGGAILVAV